MLNQKISQKNLNLIKLGLIVAIFVSPLIAANLYYHYGYMKGAVTNQGELLNGQDNLSDLHFEPLETNNQTSDNFRPKQWRVIYFADSKCDKACEQALFKLQQVHIALGKNLHRFSRTIVHSSNNTPEDWQPIYIKYPHMTSVYAKHSLPTLSKNNLYIADPLGNIILSYQLEDQDFDKKIFKDMKKLLNISKIG